MSPDEIRSIFQQCDRSLGGHGMRSIRQRMQAVVDSPLSLTFTDMYGHGGVVAELEMRVADLLGKESAVFMPSGTMAQQIALRIWADEVGSSKVAFHPTCHLHIHEQMGYTELHHLEGVLLGGANRLFTIEDLRAVPDKLSSVLIELPQREIGGQLPSWDELVEICDEVRSRGARVHMDGARLWESGPFYGRSYAEISGLFDSVYVSCYKILSGLPGAVLAGPEAFIATARIWQRRHGGNLQNQAANAITAMIGLDHHLPKMASYAAKAAEIAEVLRGYPQVRIVPEHPPTNMMHIFFSVDPERIWEASLEIAQTRKVLMVPRKPDSDGKWELNVGEAGFALSRSDIEELFEELFRLAG